MSKWDTANNVDTAAGVEYDLDVTKVLQEDAAYTRANGEDVRKFVTSAWTAK